MTNDGMALQIIQATVAGICMKGEIPETEDKMLDELQQRCNAIMGNPPTRDKIEKLFYLNGCDFAEELAKRFSGKKEEKL